MRKVILLAFAACMLVAPAYAEFAALERSTSSGGIIYNILPSSYVNQFGGAVTESSIAGIPTEGYSKTGLTADGNTRLILRYQASSAGSVTFSLSPNIATLETLDRQAITSSVRTTQVGNVYQASAVLTAPESWPAALTFPKDTFTVTATFTPDNGEAVREELTLTLQAPSVVLIHGVLSNNYSTFKGTNGVWKRLDNNGINIISWNYDNTKGPKTIINDSDNSLAKTLTDAFDALNEQGIASTRADIVAHSMGGLMARQFLRNDIDTGNKSDLSYRQGMIRRVVTIGTPNTGSSLASAIMGDYENISTMWQTWEAKTMWENILPIVKALLIMKRDATDAMEALVNNSETISQLGYPAVPFHSIYGKVAVDNDKINQIIDYVESRDIVALSGLDWLPESFVNTVTAYQDVISSILTTYSKELGLRELLTVLYDGEDNDLCVSESSASGAFPAHAKTAFEGLANHNHVTLARDGEVSARVIELLRGGTGNFAINNNVSTAQYDAAFDEYVSDVEGRIKASDADLSQFIDESMQLSGTAPEPEYFGAEEDEPDTQSVKISGSSQKTLSEDIFVMLNYGNGESKIFRMNGSNDTTFEKYLWIDGQNAGVIDVSFCTIQDGKLKISRTYQLAVAPLLYDVSGITIPNNKLHMKVNDEVKLELFAHTSRGDYDIAAPALGLATWSVNDESIARVTSTGSVVGLKAGSTELRAEAEGFTASMVVEVAGASSSSSGGSSSGCNTGFAALGLLSVLALLTKKH